VDEQRWTAVDEWLTSVVKPGASLQAALQASEDAGLPPIQVSAPQGKLLHLLARMVGARTILEVGTLGGYSTMWLALALPEGGRLVTLDVDARHAAVASRNFQQAGLQAVVEVLVGPAADTMPDLLRRGAGPFDLVFIDADKPGTADYFDWAVQLARPGSVIVVDNVVRNGALIDVEPDDANAAGMRRFVERMAGDGRVSATVIQTVGAKGYDGFALAIVG
jgi:predicted O-methyltransferase YrrM